jgi:transposase
MDNLSAMSFQGMEFTPEMRKLVVNVKLFFDHNKKNQEFFTQPSVDLAAQALGISKSTVKVIMAAFNKQGDDGLFWSNQDNRGCPAFAVESGIEADVRQFVRQANANGRQVTIELIAKHLTELHHQEIVPATLRRALIRWGFESGTGTRSAHLKETERIIIKRRRYLRQKLENRNEDGTTIRPEIYLDESYVNKNHSRDDTWYFSEDSSIISKPTGKGDRLIIVNAIGSKGWIPHAKLVFKASKKTGDYHGNMNWTLFRKWFTEQLLPNIPENSLIIMDNAPYHKVLTDEAFPKPTHSVRKLQEWLTHNEITWSSDMLKVELFDLCSRNAPKPEFSIDKLAAEQGHSILRTPPYHPELQPIEVCWAVVKGHVAAHNDFKMETVWSLLEEGFNKVTTTTIDGILKKVRKQEDAFWKEDALYSDLDSHSKELLMSNED